MLYIVTFITAVIFMIPQYADWQGIHVPLQGLISIPAIGMVYMSTFFHEIGHCLTGWLFGYAGIPIFDTNYGGGLSLHGDQSMAVLAMVYLGFALAAAAIVRVRAWGLLAGLLAVVIIHIIMARDFDLHDSLMNYMGQGGEVIIGCFCLLRGVAGHHEYGAAEKWFNMICAWFFLINAAFLDFILMTDDVAREAYDNQKGTHGFGDFSRIAGTFHLKIETTAGIALGVLVVAALASTVLGLIFRRPQV